MYSYVKLKLIITYTRIKYSNNAGHFTSICFQRFIILVKYKDTWEKMNKLKTPPEARESHHKLISAQLNLLLYKITNILVC